MRTKALLSGFLVGTAISAVAALLTTPASGREIRTKSSQNIQRIRLGIEQFSNDAKNVATQFKKTTQVSKEAIKEVGTEVKESIDDWKSDVQPTIDQLKDDIDALKKNVEQAKKPIS